MMTTYRPLSKSDPQSLVSIIFPVYNREHYVSIALDSILDQTYTNYEVIVVDDGSTDSSVEKIERFRDQFGDKLVVLRQDNMGPSYAKNTGINAATGRYIAFLDSDDFWHREKLEKQLGLFQRHQDIAFTYTGYSLVDENGDVFQEIHPDPLFSGDIYEKLWVHHNTISGGTIIVEKSKLEEAGLFDPDLKGAENLDLRIRLSKFGHVYFVSEPLYFYRKHTQSLTSDQTEMRHYHDMLLVKHFRGRSDSDPLYRKVRARLRYDDGMGCFSQQEYLAAFRLFLQSISCDPLYFRSYCQAGRCCLGKYGNKMISSVKNKNRGS